ncbi:MAG: hypothetical protein K1566_20135 [Candidatus Thiodiazotropha sp. (ex. Lucinisca nassula)]|nr:hypothetical protein [Candidatus Thiodiazotropha sp. (ex. Lucinisca nassula)]
MADDRVDLSVRHSGIPHQALPTGIFIDPTLKATDRNVLCVFRTQMSEASKMAMPTYREIKRMANIGSDATVSRAISILRLTRWIIKVGDIRDDGGRIVRTAYDICDEPECLQTVIKRDTRYLGFVKRMHSHHHPAVVHMANLVQDGIDLFSDLVADGKRSVRSLSPTEKQEIREEAHENLRQFQQSKIDKATYHAVTYSNKISILDEEELPPEARLQKLKSGTGGQDSEPRLQFLKSQKSLTSKTEEYCSSSSFNTTTTTTGENRKTSDAELFWPTLLMSELNDSERALILRRLSLVEGQDQQPLINQLTGRMMDSHQPDLEDPVKYMFWLIKKHQEGEEVLTSASTRDYRKPSDDISARVQKNDIETQLREVKSRIGSLKTLMDGHSAGKNPALHQQLLQSLQREEAALQALTEEMQQIAEN